MLDLFSGLTGIIFSGVTGNTAYAIVSGIWHKITSKSQEDLYLDAFENALEEIRPGLEQFADGTVEIDRELTREALHQKLRISPDESTYSELTSEQQLEALSRVIQEQNLLIVGGHNWTDEEYLQFCRVLVQCAKQCFADLITKDDPFKQVMLGEIEELRRSADGIRQLNEFSTFLSSQLGISLDVLKEIYNVSAATFDVAAATLNVAKATFDVVSQIATSSTPPSQPKFSRETMLNDFYSTSESLRGYIGEIAGTYIPRAEVAQIIEWANNAENNKKVALLVGERGAGKTVVMSNVLKQLDAAGIPTLALKPDLFDDEEEQNIGRIKLSEPNTWVDIEECSRFITSESPLVIIIDQIDALSAFFSGNKKLVNSVFSLISRLRLIEGVRVIAACRTFELKHDPVLKLIVENTTFTLKPLTIADVDSVLRCIESPGFAQLPKAQQDLLTTPLFLEIYAKNFEELGEAAALQTEASATGFFEQLWNIFVESPADVPTEERRDVLYTLVDYMSQQGRLSAPTSILDGFPNATQYLEHQGLLKRTSKRWAFFHSALFDYCFARKFVYERRIISAEILSSTQGLAQRLEMMPVLRYLRDVEFEVYLREIRRLLDLHGEEQLRPHLRLLLIEWLANLAHPTGEEIGVIRLLLRNVSDRKQFWIYSGRNDVWLTYLDEELKVALASPDENVVVEVLQYFGTIIQCRTQEIVSLLTPYVDLDESWNLRILWCLGMLNKWEHAQAAVEVLVHFIEEKFLSFERFTAFLYQIATSNPEAGCHLLRIYLDNDLEWKENFDDDQEIKSKFFLRPHVPSWRLKHRVEDHHAVQTALGEAFQNCPEKIVEEFLPWVIGIAKLPNIEAPYPEIHFPRSPILGDFQWWNVAPNSTHDGSLLLVLQRVLNQIAREDREQFLPIIEELNGIEEITIKNMVVDAYLAAPETFANEIVSFLTSDIRHLYLEDVFALYGSVFRFISPIDRANLEKLVLDQLPMFRRRDPLDATPAQRLERWRNDLRYFREEQLSFLSAVPQELLSQRAARHLQELQRLLDVHQINRKPYATSWSWNSTSSTVSDEKLEALSDDDWLRLIKNYDPDARHFEPPSGLVEPGKFAEYVKKEPQRFYDFAERLDASTPPAYIVALIEGLNAADISRTSVFELIQRFAVFFDTEGRRRICYLLRSLPETTEIPENIVKLIETWALTDENPTPENEREQTTTILQHADANNDQIYSQGINSVRGIAVETVAVAAILRTTPLLEYAYEFLTRVASDPSDIVHAVAIDALGLYEYEAKDTERSLQLLDQLLQGRDLLLTSHRVHKMLNWMSWHNFDLAKPYFQTMLASQHEWTKEAGAMLLCCAAFRYDEAKKMVAELLVGDVSLRRGAAKICAANVNSPDYEEYCFQILSLLVNDTDDSVRDEVSRCFQNMNSSQMYRFRPFIEAFIASPSVADGARELVNYFKNHISDDPDDQRIMLVAANRIIDLLGSQMGSIAYAAALLQDDIISLVLRIYGTDPDGDLGSSALDVFERLLMLEGFNKAYEALRDADYGEITLWMARKPC